MLRRFNYTGRKRIPRQNVPIDIIKSGDGIYEIRATFKFDGLDLPKSARVYVEAYKDTYYRRYNFGCIENIVTPDDLKLTGIDDFNILFRVKVVDSDNEGVLLAEANRISPIKPGEETARKLSLIWVKGVDLSNTIWRLELSDESEWPILEINQKIEHITEIAQRDSLFHCLVFPEVIRKILNHAIFHHEYRSPNDADDIWCLWLKFISGLPGMSFPPEQGDEQELYDWIEMAVDLFGKNNDFLRKFENETNFGGEE